MTFSTLRERISRTFNNWADRNAAALYNLYAGQATVTTTWRLDAKTKMITVLFTLHDIFLTEVPGYLSGTYYLKSTPKTTHYKSPVRYLNPDLNPDYGHYGIMVDARLEGSRRTTIGVSVRTIDDPLLQMLFECFSSCSVIDNVEDDIRRAIAHASDSSETTNAATKQYSVPMRPVVRELTKLTKRIMNWRVRLADTSTELTTAVTAQAGMFAIEFTAPTRG